MYNKSPFILSLPWRTTMSFEQKMIGFFKYNGYDNYQTPNSRKNFISNYGDHLKYLMEVQLVEKIVAFEEAKNFTELLRLVDDEELKKHLLVFDKLRDGHDYLDEVGGVLVVPFLGVGASALSLGAAIYEGGVALGIRYNLIDDDDKEHGFNAAKYLFAMVTTLALSLAFAVKSAISLITRPLITLVAEQGHDDKKLRFRDEDRGFVHEAANVVGQVVHGAIDEINDGLKNYFK